MVTIDEKAFFTNNDRIANRRVLKILKAGISVGPLMALGSALGLFEIEYWICFTLMAMITMACAVDSLLCRKEYWCQFLKYFGLITVELVLGIMASNFTIGIYISYIFIPLLSCMYLDYKLTINICIFSYIVMIIALYFRSFGAVVRDYTYFTHQKWFISQAMGYSIEYLINGIAVCSLAYYLKEIILAYYKQSIEKDYTSQTNKVKSAFIKNLSVELKASLEEVDELTRQLKQSKNLEAEDLGKIKAISNTNRMFLSKLKDLSDFSRIDLSKKPKTIRKYHLSSLMDEIRQSALSRIGDKKIDFNMVINPSLPNDLIGDKVRIRQILINLLGDTIKDTEEGFLILKIDWKRREDTAFLYIDVIDNNYEKGMSKTQIEGGTFAICKDLCERMNGTIEHISDYDKGSRISIMLPQKIVNDYILYGDVV